MPVRSVCSTDENFFLVKGPENYFPQVLLITRWWIKKTLLYFKLHPPVARLASSSSSRQVRSGEDTERSSCKARPRWSVSGGGQVYTELNRDTSATSGNTAVCQFSFVSSLSFVTWNICLLNIHLLLFSNISEANKPKFLPFKHNSQTFYVQVASKHFEEAFTRCKCRRITHAWQT